MATLHETTTVTPGRPGNGHPELATEDTRTESRSLGSLFLELTRESSALVRAEVALFRSEMDEKVTQMQQGLTSLATGGAVLFAGVLALLAAAILGMSLVMDAWLAALIVGGVVSLIGLALLMAGRSKVKAQHLTPERTMDSLRDAQARAKEQVS